MFVLHAAHSCLCFACLSCRLLIVACVLHVCLVGYALVFCMSVLQAAYSCLCFTYLSCRLLIAACVLHVCVVGCS